MIIQVVEQQPWRRYLMWLPDGERFFTQEWNRFQRFFADDDDVPSTVLEATKNDDASVTFLEDYEVIAKDDCSRINLSWSDAPFYLAYNGEAEWGISDQLDVLTALGEHDYAEVVGQYVIHQL